MGFRKGRAEGCEGGNKRGKSGGAVDGGLTSTEQVKIRTIQKEDILCHVDFLGLNCVIEQLDGLVARCTQHLLQYIVPK